jgi:hypothetical protein
MTLQKRLERILKHTTPIKLADALGVALATIYRWKKATTVKAHPALLERLAAAEKKLLP